MNRNRKVPFPVFLLISAVLNLILIQLLFAEILPDPESLKSTLEKTYIELIEIPVTEETEPPDKPSRLADKSHRAKKETTRDETTKLSRSIPRTTKKNTPQRKPTGAIDPGEHEKSTERFSPEKDRSPLYPKEKKTSPGKKRPTPTNCRETAPALPLRRLSTPK